MIRKVKDLTLEEFEEVMTEYEYGEEIFNMAMEDATYNIDEILYYFNYSNYNEATQTRESCYCIEYEIDWYHPSFLKVIVGKERDFIERAWKLSNDFAYIFNDEEKALLERLYNRADIYDYRYNDLSSDNQERLEAWFDKGMNEIATAILNYCLEEYRYFEEHAMEHAWELGLYDDYIIDDDGRIFEDVPPTYHCNGKIFTTYKEMAEEYNRTHDKPIPLF